MIPSMRTPTALPGIVPASSTSRTGQATGGAPAGQFAELFASMFPTTQAQGNPGEAAGTDMQTANAETGIPESGQPSNGSPDVLPVEPDLTETKSPEVQVSAAAGMNVDLVMSQRVQHSSLLAGETVIMETDAPAEPGSTDVVPAPLQSNLAADAAIPAGPVDAVETSAESTSGDSTGRTRFPMADVPLLDLPWPAGVAPEGTSPLPVADLPQLVVPLPEAGGSLPVAPTPQGTFRIPALAVPQAPQPTAVPVQNEKVQEPGLQPLVIASLQTAAAAMPEAATEHAVPAVADPATASTAAVEEAGPAILPTGNPVTGVIPQALGQIASQAAPTDPAAAGRVSTDVGISAVDSLEAPTTEIPLARTQTPAPLHRQLLGPIASLAAGPNGERTLSVNIAPEALGPITVKAVLGGEGIRMELSAPTDAGREALRAMLPELRRELAATGSGTIMLSTGTDSSSTPGGHTGSQNAGGGDARPFTGAPSPGLRTRGEPAPDTPGRETTLALHDTSHLDVMA